MLRKALLLSLLLHLLLLVALAHNFSLPLAPQLPFMLELRVEPAASPDGARLAAAAVSAAKGSLAAAQPRQAAQASRAAPAPRQVPPGTVDAPSRATAAVTAPSSQAAPAVAAANAAPPAAAVPAGAAANARGQTPGTPAVNAVPGGETRAARLLSAPRPDYPPLARQLGEQGVVLVRLSINEQGRVGAVTLQRSSGFSRLDKAAQAAVWQWRFAPQLDGGKAVATELELPVRFNLQESE